MDFSELHDSMVIFDYQTNQIWNIIEFLNNPFLPNSIADELTNIYSDCCQIITKDELGEEGAIVIVLKSGVFEPGKLKVEVPIYDLIDETALALESWLNLKLLRKI